jgi:hypothetical protein
MSDQSEKPKSLRIVDADTGIEIAELGAVRKKAVACIDCRFHRPSRAWKERETGRVFYAEGCTAFQRPCIHQNPNADCEYFEAKVMLVRQSSTSMQTFVAVTVSLASFIFAIVVLFGRCA